MDRETVLRKVRACLRLSKSSNAHEAAAALRQAEKLMSEYRIERGDVDVDEPDPISEKSVRRRGRTPPIYVVSLSNLIIEVFSVDCFQDVGWDSCDLIFVGPQVNVEIAGYAFDVLLRQLERDRRKHLSRVRKAANRAARGDEFGIGWVRGVRHVLGEFTGGDRDPRIAAYLDRHYPGLVHKPSEARKSKAVTFSDRHHGIQAGKKARLSHGVGGHSRAQLGHEASAP